MCTTTFKILFANNVKTIQLFLPLHIFASLYVVPFHSKTLKFLMSTHLLKLARKRNVSKKINKKLARKLTRNLLVN